MKPIITFFTLLACAVSALTGGAKDLSKFMLRGYIYDKEYNTIDSVNVSLSKDNDSIPLKYKILVGNDKENVITGGQLRMMVHSGLGAYTLVLEKDGFEPLVKTFKITSIGEEVKYLGGLVMEKERFRQLDEVTVTATKVKMVMKGDTIEYDAAAFRLNEGSMLDALVRQLPGASIDADGVITVNGRKINELLINGKDFFKGEPKVALRNLPAYTVKNVQVYDKKADDANITFSDAKIDTREDEQNLVMDVNLKKEYDTGWMANAEAGIGTADRYRARAFGLGYTRTFRLAAFANANNVGDTDKASTDGEWNKGWNEDGLLNVKMGGINYNLDNSDKIRMDGNLTVTHEDVNYENITATTQFYPSGDLFKRAVAWQKEKKNHLMTNHNFVYKGDHVNVSVRPSVDWLVRDRGYNTRSAMFASNPQESTRGEAINDLFANGFQGRYSESLLTALHTLRAQHDNWLDMSLNSSVLIRPTNWRGYLTLWANGSYYDSPLRERTLYKPAVGPLGDPESAPKESDRYHTTSQRRETLSGGASYNFQKNFYNDIVSKELYLNIYTSYSYDHRSNDTDYFLADSVGAMNRLPAIMAPADAYRDLENTRYSTPTNRKASVSAHIGFVRQPLAPGDSSFNATFNASLGCSYVHDDRRLHFMKPEILDENVHRVSDYVSPSISFYLSSANKKRYINASISGYMSTTPPSLTYLINTVDNSDPFNIVTGNPDGLKDERDFQTTLRFSRFSRASHRAGLYWDAHLYINRNTVAMARMYDPATGVTLSRPENVNGNWHVDSYLQYSVQAGPRQQVELFGMLYGEHHNIVDYNALMTTPERYTLHNNNFSGRIRVTYKFRQGSTLTFQAGKGWNGVRSPRESFDNLNTHSCNFDVKANLILPYDIEANSSLTFAMRRGFTDSAMNVNEWLWNASASKSILKGKMSLKLTAYDLLNSVKSVSQSVTAIGRTETWRRTMPRYVLLSVAYRFDMKPKGER